MGVQKQQSEEQRREGQRTFSRQEIAKHNTPEDAWVTVNGYVLNVTAFLQNHPGGPEVIHQYLGGDVKEAMAETDHSPYAYTLMKQYAIGTVEGEKTVEAFPAPEKQMRGYEVPEIQDCVDFSKPVLPQISTIGDKYWPWMINRPVCPHNTIFPYKFMEVLSRWPWWYIWVIWPPVFLYNMFVALTSANPIAVVGYFAIGILIWSLAEYFLHRFVFHMEVKSNAGNVFHFFAHGVHHLSPTDSSRLTFPPPFAVGLSILIFNLIAALTPAGHSNHGIFAGFVAGYVLYDTAHFYFHHSDFDNALFRYCKSSHLGHHYKNEDKNFGVTSPLWDLVFGTYDPYNRSTAPAVKDD